MTTVHNNAANDLTAKKPSSVLGIIAPDTRVFDLDPLQWQRWFDLLFKPVRTADGLYLLHDEGRLLSVTPVYARRKLDLPDVIADPTELAKQLYQQWGRGPVAIVDRQSLGNWFDQFQREFTADDDIFSLLLKAKDLYLESSGLTLFPNPIGGWANVAPEMISSVTRSLAPADTPCSVVFAAYDGGDLWASALLGFENGFLKALTTLPMAHDVDWRSDYQRLLPLAADLYAPATIGIFCQRETLTTLGISPQSWSQWLAAIARKEVMYINGS